MTSENRPKISYIVPVYNGQSFIHRCLDSILSQRFKGIEVVFVDDGSCDDSAQILQSISSKHGSCRVFSQKNMGCGAARNTAIRGARGEFLAILDVDDIAVGERSQLQYEKAVDSDADLIVGGSRIVDLNRNEIGSYTPPARSDSLYNALLNRRASFHHSSCLMRRAKVMSLGGYSERLRLGGDLDLFYRLFETGNVSAVKEVVVEHTRHENSLSNGPNIEESLFMGVFVTACHLLRKNSGINIIAMEDQQYVSVLQTARQWFAKSGALAEFRFRQKLKAGRDRRASELLRIAALNPVSTATSALTNIRGDRSAVHLARYLSEYGGQPGLPRGLS